MCSRNHTYFTGNRTNFIQCSSIRTNFIYRDHFSYNRFGQMIQTSNYIGFIIRINFFKMIFSFFSYFFHMSFSCKLIGIENCFSQIVFSIFINSFFYFFGYFCKNQFFLLLAYFFNYFFLKFNKLFYYGVSIHNCIKNFFLRCFFCSTFNHQNSCFRTCYCNIHRRAFQLFLRRIYNKFTINFTDSDTSYRTVPRNI